MVVSLHERIAIIPTYDQISRQQNDWLGTIQNLKATCFKQISKKVEQSRLLVWKPWFKLGISVRIAKQDLLFQKKYNQKLNDEVFEITKVATFSPPTSSLSDKNGEDIQGKFYETDLINIRWKCTKLTFV